jgi:hypothetical protein
LNYTAARYLPESGPPRFVRRTTLAPHEYRKNFRQIDSDIIAALTSREADAVTPQMSKIYLRLVSAPAHFWEREGVLFISAAQSASDRPLKASRLLYELLGVASATAHKALSWMHEQGIIGYAAGKNGVGIRIFLNRATTSIGVRPGREKILPFGRSSTSGRAGSAGEPAFKDSYAVREVLETEEIRRLPAGSAGRTAGQHVVADATVVSPRSPQPVPPNDAPESCRQSQGFEPERSSERQAQPSRSSAGPKAVAGVETLVEDVISRLSRELLPTLQATARSAAALEHDRTRLWLETRGLPKAARVAQSEAFAVLRRHGLISETAAKRQAEVGRGVMTASEPRRLGESEVEELAQGCLALLETQGRALEATLAELSSTEGGYLLAEDVERVRCRAAALLGFSNP